MSRSRRSTPAPAAVATPVPAAPAADPVHIRWAAAIIAIAGVLVYANTFSAPFVFDDALAVVNNASIRQWSTAFFPPETAGSAAARPLLNFSLALNYAWGGTRVESYHALNVAIHVGAGLLLFGTVRRTLQLPRMAARWRDTSGSIALGSALLWTVHPLLTESVTCIAQRSESLVGLWYLLMFYGIARSENSSAPRRWRWVAFAACLLGVLSKEVMVTAPVLACLFYAAFVDGSWREVWQRRWRYGAALAVTWVPLLLLVWHNRTRDGAAGFGLGITPWEYALTQCRALTHYLSLSVWPHPLVLDYGEAVATSLTEVWPQAVFVVTLLGLTLFATIRRWPAAFAGAWFFVILAPSSSVVPLITQTMAEHRMYLPLAGILVLAVAGVHAWLGRRAVVALTLIAPVLMVVTWQRNQVYRSSLLLWQDTVAHAPNNPRARTNLGNVLDESGQGNAAESEYRAALNVAPGHPLALYNLGMLLMRQGRSDEAIAAYAQAIKIHPADAGLHVDFGLLLVRQGHLAEAQAHFETALRLAPTNALAHNNLAHLLFNQGRIEDAVREFRAALPGLDNASLHMNLAIALDAAGHTDEAIEEFKQVLRKDSSRVDARTALGAIYLQHGRRQEAQAVLREALLLKPDDAQVQALLKDAEG